MDPVSTAVGADTWGILLCQFREEEWLSLQAVTVKAQLYVGVKFIW